MAREVRIGDWVGLYGSELSHPETLAVAASVLAANDGFITVSVGAIGDQILTVPAAEVYGPMFVGSLPSPLQPCFFSAAQPDDHAEIRLRSALMFVMVAHQFRCAIFARPASPNPYVQVEGDAAMTVEHKRTHSKLLQKFAGGNSFIPIELSHFDRDGLLSAVYKVSGMPRIACGSVVGALMLICHVRLGALVVSIAAPESFTKDHGPTCIYDELGELLTNELATLLNAELPMWMIGNGGCRLQPVPTMFTSADPLMVDPKHLGAFSDNVREALEACNSVRIGYVVIDSIRNGRDLALLISIVKAGAFANNLSTVLAHGAIGRVWSAHCPGLPALSGRHVFESLRLRTKLKDGLIEAKARFSAIPHGIRKVQGYNYWCAFLIGRYGVSSGVVLAPSLVLPSKLAMTPRRVASSNSVGGWPVRHDLSAGDVAALDEFLLITVSALENHVRDSLAWWASFKPAHCPRGLRVVRGERFFSKTSGWLGALNLLWQAVVLPTGDIRPVSAPVEASAGCDSTLEPAAGTYDTLV